MPVNAYWLLDKKVYVQDVWGEVNSEDVLALKATFKIAIEEGDRPWYSLVNALEITNIAIGINIATQLIRKDEDAINTPALNLILINNRALRFMGTVMGNLLQQTYHFFPTKEEALDFLQQRDPLLPPFVWKED